MTQEEKLQLAKEWYNDPSVTEEVKAHLEELFPELKESEDLKIKRDIQYAVRCAYGDNSNNTESIFAWLEKQGEQNLNKVKPEFKVGDWVVHKETGIVYQVEGLVKLNCGYAYNLTDGGYISSFKSDEYRLWTIQDAKDGDILAVGDTVVIFKDLYHSSTFHSYCHIEDGVFNISKDDMPDWWRCEGFKPANIEQGELLFQKMNEAGYVWDFENKELKQIEQNTACYEKYIANIFEKVGLAKIVREKGSDELTNAVQYAMIELSKFISQQKTAWSEEDEKERKHLLGMLKGWLNTFRETIYKYDCNKAISWLESLKPQPKQQWSEEDESHIGRTLSYLESFKAYNIPHIEPIKKEIDWLKSLKEKMKGE